MTFVEAMQITESEIARELRRFLWTSSCTLLPRIQIGDYERDLLKVMKSGFAHEYEIKRTRSDYLADLRKNQQIWNHDLRKMQEVFKHEILAGEADRPRRWFQVASFTFILPEGLLKEGESPPPHCSVIEYRPRDRSWGYSRLNFKRVSKRKRLTRPDRLSLHQMYVLLSKIESRFWDHQDLCSECKQKLDMRQEATVD